MQKENKFTYILAAFLVALVFIISSVWGSGMAISYAAISSDAVSNYTNVLDDLRTDATFNIDEYPTVIGDYSLNVKQIAESSNGELFIYVYQPCGLTRKHIASSINISTAINENLKYSNYKLKFLNSSGVFYKYKVEDFTVKKDLVRYYDISEIFRKWDGSIDPDTDENNTINEKAFAVAQLWTTTTSGNSVAYNMTETEVLIIDDQYIGFKRYSDGFQWANTKSCDAHFFAFSTSHRIDALLSADISFFTQDYKALAGSGTKFSQKEKHFVTLYHDDEVSNDGSGWFGKKQTWQRMASTEEFLKSVEWTEEESAKLAKYDWVLNFYETDYICEAGGKDVLITALVPFGFIWTIVNGCTTDGTIVSEVVLMRLEFETDGKIYNLGVVSDIQTGSGNPIGDDVKNNSKIKIIIAVVALVVLIIAIILIISKFKGKGNTINVYTQDYHKKE